MKITQETILGFRTEGDIVYYRVELTSGRVFRVGYDGVRWLFDGSDHIALKLIMSQIAQKIKQMYEKR